jgi:hypothetical protein
MTTNQKPNPTVAARKPYSTPKLTTFGEVRVLTQTQTSGSTEGSSGTGAMKPSCDRRLKESIVEIGVHPQGFKLYLFEYKAQLQERYGRGRRFGVMADEVAPLVPEAVTLDDDGFYRVDLGQLGIVPHLH